MNPKGRFGRFFKEGSKPHRMFNNFIGVKQTVGLMFLFLAFSVFSMVAYSGGDAGRIIVMIYGFIVLVMGVASLVGYVGRTVALQNDKTVARYVAINSVNTFVGLLIPLFLINEVVRMMINLAAQLTNYGTLFCHIRCTVVDYYWKSDIYNNVNTLLFWGVVILLGYWLIGGLVERFMEKK